MEEIPNTGFDPSSVVYLAVAAMLVLLSFRALWRAARQRRRGPVLAGLWLLSVASFGAAAALLIGVTEWVPYAPATRAADSHDPQSGVGRGLELLVSNAVLVAMTAIVLSTLILFTAGRKGTGRPG